jgi:hypothetical protein
VRQFLNRDVYRIYLLGREGEFSFLDSVVERVTREPELHGLESFSLTHGYNGFGGGRAVLLEIDRVMESLRLERAPIDEVDHEQKQEHEQEQEETARSAEPTGRAGLGEAEGVVYQALAELETTEFAWVHSGSLGARISRLSPNFDVRHYGYQRMRPLLEALKSVEVEMRTMPNGPPVMYVRRVA